MRKLREAGVWRTGPVTVWLREGTYHINEPVVLGGRDFGSPKFPVSWRIFGGEHPVVSDGIPNTGWTQVAPGHWAAA